MINRIFAIVVLAISGLFFFQTTKFSEKSGVQTFAPSFFPRIILFLIVMLSLYLLVKSFLKRDESEKVSIMIKKYVKEHYQVLAIIGLFFLYVLFISIIGFLISSIFFLFITFTILRPKKVKSLLANALVAIALTVSIQYVFQQMLNIYLP
ncbi:tripartite tricarboxylate transporter TctB family protein [Litchfieldia salsa]|uniref:Tripartite tricarboxylate transporter TctB family protein n=1 Tax=Litchfieldia salsa TaxID=930152 RepID=A0A1H0PS97_9BACI|nr:tripartite tricarboxylate transporter TctB family protein [Litchfieldia salsa]SDP08002.1 Tripartite tricarboxylate transporter TctB family protein [Litchfieldia salsa]